MAFGPAEMQQMGQMIAQMMAENTRNFVEQLMKTKRRTFRHDVDRRAAGVGLNEGVRLPRTQHKDESLACEPRPKGPWLAEDRDRYGGNG